MTKKQAIVCAIVSALAIVVVFGFASFMASRGQTWSAQHKVLSEPLVIAINVGSLIQSRPLPTAIIAVAVSFGLVWILG